MTGARTPEEVAADRAAVDAAAAFAEILVRRSARLTRAQQRLADRAAAIARYLERTQGMGQR